MPAETATPAQAHAATQVRARSKPTGGYIPGLDGMRAIAFFMVFFAHALGRYGIYVPATLGVTIFFFLSGYLITTLLRREWEKTGTVSLRDFYIRRTLRIFAPLYVTYAIACLVARIAGLQTGNWKGWISMLFYFFNYANNLGWGQILPHGLDVIWSLAVEEHFYLLFPLAFLLMSRRGWPWARQARVLAVLCLLDIPWRYFMTQHFGVFLDWTYRATDSRFDSILWGCILALAWNPRFKSDPPLLNTRRALPYFLLACAGLFATMLWSNEWYRQVFRYTIQSLLLAPIFAFVLTRTDHPLVRWLEWKPVRYLGWLSYVLYLCHAAVLETVRHFLSGTVSTVVLSLAISIAFATLMRYTLELPLQHLRERFRHVSEGPSAGEPAVLPGPAQP